jgi:predicted MFS family arabinose efflux permease
MTAPSANDRPANRATFRGALLIVIGLAGAVISFIGGIVEGWAPFRVVTVILGLTVAALAAREVHLRRGDRS